MTALTDAAPRAHVGRRSVQLVASGAALALLAFALFRLLGHVGVGGWLAPVYVASLVLLAWDLLASAGERTPEPTPAEAAELAALRVVALVPVYNEDEVALRTGLASLLAQSRRLDAICVTDDGSTTGDYDEVRAWFAQECAARGVVGHWSRRANGGKRAAQVTALRHEPDADVYVTVDSDTVLDPDAVAHGLHPFADPRVQSVAGLVLVANYGTNVLTRLQELSFTTMQIVNRGALSRMGSVQVNSGGLAFYRADVLRDNVDAYLTETCRGRSMHASDDSLLTLYALRRGRTVHQLSSIAFTLMPTSFSHHRRQQLRWMRGSTVRSGSRFRSLPLDGFAFWQHLVKWMMYAVVTVAFAALLLTGTLFSLPLLGWSALVVTAVQLVVAAPYLALRRSDQTTRQRLAVVATAPLVGLWQLTFLRVLRWYAMLTFPRVATGWGTRTGIEVGATA